MSRITIIRENGQYNVYRGEQYIASINDFRAEPKTGSKADRFSRIRDNWNVCWLNGRVDWHGTYAEARDNALKGL